jgi:hypothetical protein
MKPVTVAPQKTQYNNRSQSSLQCNLPRQGKIMSAKKFHFEIFFPNELIFHPVIPNALYGTTKAMTNVSITRDISIDLFNSGLCFVTYWRQNRVTSP